MTAYWYPYAYWFRQHLWFLWLLRWWTGVFPAYMGASKEQEIAFLEYQRRLLEEMLSQVNERLEDLRKERPTPKKEESTTQQDIGEKSG